MNVLNIISEEHRQISIIMKCSTIQKEIILAHYLANIDMGVKYPSRQLRRPIPVKDSDIIYAGKSLSDLFEESRQEAIQTSPVKG